MKKTIRLLLILFVNMWSVLVFSQAKNAVTGLVADSTGSPLQGVTIRVKGTKISTLSNAQGSFTIPLSAVSGTLEFSSVGYANKEVEVSAGGSVNVMLSPTVGQLNEVVVTALGIQKQKKSLGYAVQEVKGQTLVEAREVNLVNDLSGKVAGLQVTRSGNGLNGSSKITLRGNNSLTGSNQPLIVVDGIPMENATGRTGIGATNDFWNPSLDYGNGLSDINADDIASISVLKGPAASALYGSRAGNGVILITTKTGRKQPGIGITVSSSVGFESIFANPDEQSSFGQGSNDLYDPHSGQSWGPKITGQTVTDWQGNQVQLKAYDNVGNFYNTGVVSNQNISFQQQFNNTSIYTSYNRLDDKSMIPGEKLSRNNLLARTVTKFGNNNRWTIDTKVQYTNATANNRSLVGQNGNTFSTIYSFPVSLDITQFKNTTDSAGNMRWYATGSQVNPYWAAKYNLNTDTRNRFLLYGSLKYQFTDWLSAQINGGSDMYTENTEQKLYAGSPSSTTGSYGIGKQTYQETDYSTLITATKNNVFGKLGGSVTLGGNLMAQKNSAINGNAGALKVPNLFSLGNAAGYPTVGQTFWQKRINSVYGSVELNYDDYLFLSGTFRNDWSSTLSAANRSYFYPSVSASYVFTDMINKAGGYLPKWLSYGKLRLSYASVGNDLDPYQLYNTYYIGTDPNGNTTAGRNSVLYNDSVRSELIKSYEAGAEMRFFNNRFGFDIAIYKSDATRQLLNLPMDPLSGYSAKKINAGDIQNKGIEVTVDGQILKRPSSFGWNVTLNYSTNDNTVVSLYQDVTQYQLGGFDNIQVLAVTGAKYGEIYGSTLARVTDNKDPNFGQLLLTDNGLPQKSGGSIVRLGNQQANALLGLTNSFSYKGFNLSVLIDGRFGGKIFSGTLDNMQRAGTAAVTVVNGARDSMIVNGVILNSSTNQYEPNTNKVSVQQYWGAVAGADNIGITEANLYDASNIRIRNIELSYNLSHKLLARSVLQKAVISVSCNNVWLISSHMHGLDPESVFATGSNATGFENGSAPTSRIIYINLTLGF
ncbi:MAG: SusC/RagA family TonB-linked outer membrane protein [Chitinophagaceae bacterium]